MKEKYYEIKYKWLKGRYSEIKKDRDSYKRLFEQYYGEYHKLNSYTTDLQDRYKDMLEFYENEN